MTNRDEEKLNRIHLMISEALDELKNTKKASVEVDNDEASDAIEEWDHLGYSEKPIGFLMYFLCCNECMPHAAWCIVIPLSKGYCLVKSFGYLYDLGDFYDIETMLTENVDEHLYVISIFKDDGKLVGLEGAMREFTTMYGSIATRTRICEIANTFILEEMKRLRKCIKEDDLKSVKITRRRWQQ